MNYAKIRKLDVSNGPGIRATLFVSGCTHNCKGCFNSEAQDFNFGKEFTKEVEDKFIEYVKSYKVTGVNILGGEPFQQDKEVMINLLKRIKEETNKSVWVWSGFKFENLIELKDNIQLLEYVDVLIDGKFEIDKRDMKLKYRGSCNQRVINVKETLNQRKIVEIDI